MDDRTYYMSPYARNSCARSSLGCAVQFKKVDLTFFRYFLLLDATNPRPDAESALQCFLNNETADKSALAPVIRILHKNSGQMIIISSVPHECLHGFLSQTSLSACFQWQLPYYVPPSRVIFPSIRTCNSDGIIIADSTGTQMVGLAHSRKREYSLPDLFLHIFRQRLFKQFVHARNQQPYRHLHDKETDYHRSNRIEHPPMISQQDGTADTDGRPDRRQCIRAHWLSSSPRVQLLALKSLYTDKVSPFETIDTDKCCHQCHYTGRF